jgi:hypothetical protein
MNRELLLLVDALAREKNVPKDIVFTALESALASATKKRFTEEIDARCRSTAKPATTRPSAAGPSCPTKSMKNRPINWRLPMPWNAILN